MLTAPGRWSPSKSSWPSTSTSWAPSFSRRLTSVTEKTWDGIYLMYSAGPYAHRGKPEGDIDQDSFAGRFRANPQLRLVKDLGGIPRRQPIARQGERTLDQIDIACPHRPESTRGVR